MPAPDVALITPYPPSGQRHGGSSGVASYSANLAHALAARGAAVRVLAPAIAGEPARSADGPVEVLRPFRRGTRALPHAARAARASGAPVTHLQHELFLYGGPGSVPGLLPALGALRTGGRRSVVTMHHVVDPRTVDAEFTRTHRVSAPPAVARAGLGGVQSAIGRMASEVIVHEPSFAAHVPGATVVPHGIETPDRTERTAARAALGLDDRFLALCFGFLAPYKGLELALAAADRAGPDVHLVVAGGEHPRLATARDGYAHELADAAPANATFTGYVPDAHVASWFAAADVALFLYPQPFAASGPLSLALAHGTPALVSPGLARTVDAPDGLVTPLDAAA
ncbi:MAG: hypothetical protein AVDCRST_MAG54-1423, partial [uncultured Actinomycetospora sp.]